jgi:hypothetical protein
MNPQMMMGGQPPMPGQPPAGGQQGMLMAALMGGAGMDTLGGDPLQQVLIDFPLQPPMPPLDDGMMDGGFPALNLAGGMMQGQQQAMDPNMLAMLMQGGGQQGPPQMPGQPQPPMASFGATTGQPPGR